MPPTGKAKQLVDPQGGQKEQGSQGEQGGPEEQGGQEEQGGLEGWDHQWGPIDVEGLTHSLEQYRK